MGRESGWDRVRGKIEIKSGKYEVKEATREEFFKEEWVATILNAYWLVTLTRNISWGRWWEVRVEWGMENVLCKRSFQEITKEEDQGNKVE